MKFNCPTCQMHLMAEPDMAGQVVNCPGCNTKIQIPAEAAGPEIPPPDINRPRVTSPSAPGGRMHASGQPQERKAWKEEDPTNPNAKLSFGVGIGLTITWFLIVYPFQASHGTPQASFTLMQGLANLFYKHFTVSFMNTLFFFWAMTICYLKLQKLKHQKAAMLLDVLPMELGKEINGDNVGIFIDHIYRLPFNLRDSLMVNRIRKALEFFEVRQNVGHVSAMMGSQSAIDGSRIMGSYILLRAFLWAIPLLGFIGTVVGLSHAISGMSFGAVEDVGAIMGSINNVTSGLGTAFDATLLGLVFAVLLNFPLNSLLKHEEEALNDIDAFCNEVLLPRLNDGGSQGAGDIGVIGESIIRGLSGAQKEFLVDLNELSSRMLQYADNLDRRVEVQHNTAVQQFVTNMTTMRQEVEANLSESMRLTSQYIGSLDEGLRGLNAVLGELGGKQIVIEQPKKKGWFGRSKG
ncbi:MAG: MotA/TolQ/ExbB proton channel family protein [Chthoniobacteraceae bacterium]